MGNVTFYESSNMRSSRDRDAVGRSWIKHKSTAAQVSAAMRALANIQSQVNKIRRRVVGGQTVQNGWKFSKPISYNYKSSYNFQDIIYIAPDDLLITNGYEDPDSHTTVYPVAGMWVALKVVKPSPDPDIIGSFVYHIPQLPYPAPSDPDNALNYWWLIAPDAQCY